MGPPPRSPPQQQQQPNFIQHQMFQQGPNNSFPMQNQQPQRHNPIRDPEFSDEEYNRGINKPGQQFNNNQYGGGGQHTNYGNGYNR